MAGGHGLLGNVTSVMAVDIIDRNATTEPTEKLPALHLQVRELLMPWDITTSG